MTILDEKNPGPSLTLVATFVAILTAFAFGGMFAYSNATSAGTSAEQATPAAPVETGNI
jgi:hypothetical protein